MKKKTILALATASIMMACTAPAFAGPEMFATVPAKHWSYDAMAQLAQAGIIDGYENGYNGRSRITRYEMAIMIANAMTNVQKANSQQKEVLEKLMKEYNAELVSLGAQVSKEKKKESASDNKNKVNFLFDNRLGFDYTSLGSTEGGGVGDKNIKDKGQFSERIRIYMTVPFGDDNKWSWNSRLYQQKTNFEVNDTSSNMKFDRFYVTGNDVFGGKLELGKNFIHPGKAGFFNLAGDADSAIYTWTAPEKNWSARVGTGRAAPQPGSASNSDVFLGEITYKPTKTSDIELYNIKQNGNNNLEDLDLWGLAGAAELNKKSGLSLSFEYGKNNANDFDKSGYWVALNSNYKATNYNPGMFTRLVNPFVKGDHGWAVSYRHMPNGVSGKDNRAAFLPWLPVSQDTASAWQNSFNDINAWRIDYMYVPVKNIQLTLTYDHIKPINDDWTNNSFQTIVNFIF